MIEPRNAPAYGAVALTAVRTQASTMRIVVLVTAHARGRRTVVALVGVTGCAPGRLVCALKRKACVGMVKANLAPTVVGMAAAATNTQPSTVRFVAPVAVHASARGFPEFAARRVAGRTSDAHMGAPQRIVGDAVVEIPGV